MTSKPEDPSTHETTIKTLQISFQIAIQNYNRAAISLGTLQSENLHLNPKARHIPPATGMEIPNTIMWEMDKRCVESLREELRGIREVTGMMEGEVGRLRGENRGLGM